MTIPYDIGPDRQLSGEPFRNRVRRLGRMGPIFGTCVTPTLAIPFSAPERPPDGPAPLVSASWRTLMSSLAARHRDDMARRQYFERMAMAPLDITGR